MVYNPLTCKGFGIAGQGWVAGGDCLKSRLGFVILFFIAALLRKWGGEEMGIPFSFVFSLLGGMLSYFFVIVLFGSFKIAFVIGLVGIFVGGYGGGIFFGGGDESY